MFRFHVQSDSWKACNLLIICIALFGCPDPPDNPSLSPELISALQSDYTDNNYTAPPDDAFTNRDRSIHYDFWTGAHLQNRSSLALNTADRRFSGIAILRWEVELDSEADEVMNIYIYDLKYGTGPVLISSAYRNPSRNARVGGVSESAHIWGRAIDFDGFTDEENNNICEAADRAGASYTLVHDGHCHAAW